MNEALSVEIIEVPTPMILCNGGFLATLSVVEKQVSELKITDATTAQQAADLQSRLTTAAKTLDTQRKALNKPFDDQIAAINAAAKQPAQRIEQAKQSVSKALTAFAVEQQRQAREAEMKRQQELARLQEQAEKERLEATAKLIAAPSAPDDDWGEPAAPVVVAPTETEKKIAAAIAAPAVVVAKPSGVTIRTTLKAIVEDLDKVPLMFIERAIKMRAIESTFCVKFKAGDPLPVCSGIRFEIETKTVSTGR